jgi:hypothetical protein
MLVHKFYLNECIGLNSNFDLNSNRFEVENQEKKYKRTQTSSPSSFPRARPSSRGPLLSSPPLGPASPRPHPSPSPRARFSHRRCGPTCRRPHLLLSFLLPRITGCATTRPRSPASLCARPARRGCPTTPQIGSPTPCALIPYPVAAAPNPKPLLFASAALSFLLHRGPAAPLRPNLGQAPQ